MIQDERVQHLNGNGIRDGKYVLYWMQSSQRSECNHALEYAILKASKLNRPLVVFFGITETFPDANARHYHFMLEGLNQVRFALEDRNIRMIIVNRSPEVEVVRIAKYASLVVTDRGYLKILRRWRNYVARRVDCPLVQVESDVVVPVEEASIKEEYSAATLRPKIRGKLNRYLVPLAEEESDISADKIKFDSFDIEDVDRAVSHLKIDMSVSKVNGFHGGTDRAKKELDIFLRKKLDDYPRLRNDPNRDCLSNLSPYLHFGQISPLHVVLEVLKTDSPAKEAFLEELIVRRELSMNFIFHNQNYDAFDGLPEWAKRTLIEHEKDTREYSYTLQELENAETHDTYWNAAQKEMKYTGKMSGYMRMYWGKKIIEWTKKPSEAFEIALYLNNKYELDGRDPNSFAGVAWCFGKHDRPWKQRKVFGKIRYMNAEGLKRKFDADAYVRKVRLLTTTSPKFNSNEVTGHVGGSLRPCPFSC